MISFGFAKKNVFEYLGCSTAWRGVAHPEEGPIHGFGSFGTFVP